MSALFLKRSVSEQDPQSHGTDDDVITTAQAVGGIDPHAAQQSAGAKIPVEWIGVNQELDKLKKQSKPSAAVKILLKSIQDSGSTQGQ